MLIIVNDIRTCPCLEERNRFRKPCVVVRNRLVRPIRHLCLSNQRWLFPGICSYGVSILPSGENKPESHASLTKGAWCLSLVVPCIRLALSFVSQTNVFKRCARAAANPQTVGRCVRPPLSHQQICLRSKVGKHFIVAATEGSVPCSIHTTPLPLLASQHPRILTMCSLRAPTFAPLVHCKRS